MLIGVSGLGYTGSGAVVDLLKEYKDTNVYDENEFWLAFANDGLEDLAYHLFHPCRFMNSDIAVLRFKKYITYTFRRRGGWGRNVSKEVESATDDFLSNVIQLKWKGTWGRDLDFASPIKSILKWHFCQSISRWIREKTHGNKMPFPYRDMYLSVCPTDFYEFARRYVDELFEILGYKGNRIVLNQPFCGDHPERSFPFFRDPKAIVVDKDPRDLYFLCKREIKANTTWMPTDNVEQFVEYYRAIRSTIDYTDSDDVLHLCFEDLIYEYDNTVQVIERFLNISPESHTLKKTFMIPEKSINNTQLFRKHSDCLDDTKYIEEHLTDYLYPFDRYTIKDVFGESF